MPKRALILKGWLAGNSLRPPLTSPRSIPRRSASRSTSNEPTEMPTLLHVSHQNRHSFGVVMLASPGRRVLYLSLSPARRGMEIFCALAFAEGKRTFDVVRAVISN